jgi:hypothetical protein
MIKAALLALCCVAASTACAQKVTGTVADMTYSYELVDVNNGTDAIAFEVTSPVNSWLGFGLGNPDLALTRAMYPAQVIILSDSSVRVHVLSGRSAGSVVDTLNENSLPEGIHSFSFSRTADSTTLRFTASEIDGK